MIVMKEHDWFDSQIYEVRSERMKVTDEKIICLDTRSTTVLISKQDVIALAKEFNLIVFEKESQL